MISGSWKACFSCISSSDLFDELETAAFSLAVFDDGSETREDFLNPGPGWQCLEFFSHSPGKVRVELVLLGKKGRDSGEGPLQISVLSKHLKDTLEGTYPVGSADPNPFSDLGRNHPTFRRPLDPARGRRYLRDSEAQLPSRDDRHNVIVHAKQSLVQFENY